MITRSQKNKTLDKMPKPDENVFASKSESPVTTPVCVPLHKWNLSYDGTTDVRNFIERVEELALSRNVSTVSLFSSAVELFSGIALDWYRVNRALFTSWSDIVSALKEEFELLDHERRLLAQIRATVQLQKETLGSFITRVSLLNNRLSSKLPEEEILEILQCNMLPRYIQKLSLSVIPDISTLKKLGKMIELADSRSGERATPSNTISNPRNSGHSANNTSENFNNSARGNYHKRNFTPNNVENIHDNNKRSPSKFNSREVYCFRCGRPGVKAPSCNCRHSKN